VRISKETILTILAVVGIFAVLVVASFLIDLSSKSSEFIDTSYECHEYQTRQEQVCEGGGNSGGALLGGIIGHFVAGSDGAVVGSIVGGSGATTTRCHQETVKHCVRRKVTKNPNPRYRGPNGELAVESVTFDPPMESK
jgi:hypothetical protein